MLNVADDGRGLVAGETTPSEVRAGRRAEVSEIVVVIRHLCAK
jgi:hypothetical protein